MHWERVLAFIDLHYITKAVQEYKPKESMFYLLYRTKKRVIRQRGRLSYIADEGRGVGANYNNGKNRVLDPYPHGSALI
jgi:hypothetical protein